MYCPIHGYIKHQRLTDVFLCRAVSKHPPDSKAIVVEELLYGIIDRASIGRGIAILDDEVDNFNYIVKLAEKAIECL
jgi:hypothetical protein